MLVTYHGIVLVLTSVILETCPLEAIRQLREPNYVLILKEELLARALAEAMDKC
jgi:sulfur transfer complex TusBCD TusB component (DsrH family)